MTSRPVPPLPAGSDFARGNPACGAADGEKPGSDFACTLLGLLALALFLGACGGEEATEVGSESDLPAGADTFLSAAGDVGDTEASDEESPDGTSPAATEASAAGAADAEDDSAVEEGDIYRVLDGSLVINLNHTRGLQVIDFSDPDDPVIIGRTQTTGSPLEMYIIGDQAWVLLNHWRGYASVHAEGAGERGPGAVIGREGMGQRSGGAILRIDLSDPMQPEVRQSVHVPGTISRSRVVRSESRGEAALYVASSHWRPVLLSENCEDFVRSHLEEEGHDAEEIASQLDGMRESGEMEGLCRQMRWRPWAYETIAHVRSYSLTGDALQEVEQLELGGMVTGIQATPQMLMVARGHQSWWTRGEGSEVQLIDIGSTSGEMRARGEVKAEGRIFSQFHMDIHGDILRVVSGSRWGSREGNFIQTWDISDPDDPQPVDMQSFGFPDDDLYATLFLGNRAFFVTYERIDPFHAFEITDEGYATEINEFIVSGWNDFFRPVFDTRRLIGIGMNDEHGGARAAVSLYDITDLANPDPLITRAEVEAQWTWSAANWDHRAFSVLEGAADAVADDGTPETGLILLPFSGRDRSINRRVSAVQVFTFSESTVTRRGTMEHDSWVQRSFLADADAQLAGNLSGARFSLFDIANPDAPTARGSLQLAPNYIHYLPLGGLALRVVGPDTRENWESELEQWEDWDGDWRSTRRMEIIEANGHPDLARPLGALLTGVYDHYLEMDGRVVAVGRRHEGQRVWSTHLAVFDVDDPAQPRTLGTLQPDILIPSGWNWGYTCWHCWSWRPSTPQVWLLGDQLLLAGTETLFDEDADRPRVESCYSSIPYELGRVACDVEGDVLHCNRHQGARSCERPLPGGEFTCREWGQQCEETHDLTSGAHTIACDEPDWSLLGEERCNEFERIRPVRERMLRIARIDLSDPTAPAEAEVLEITGFDRSGSILQDDDVLYHSWAEEVEADGRAMLRWFIQPLRMVDGALERGATINIPGIAMTIRDGYLLSEDRVWVEGEIRAALRVSRIDEDRVVLVGSHFFPERRTIQSLAFEPEQGHLLALTQTEPQWYIHPMSPFVGQPGQPTRNRIVSEALDVRMEVFSFDGEGITARGTVAGDHGARLRTMIGDLALLQVGRGLLVVDVSDPDNPQPTAWHPTQQWPQALHEHQGVIVFPAWGHGIYRIDPQERNLLE